jgi:hypothetical protein
VGHGRQGGVTVDSARELAGVCTSQVSTSAGWKTPVLRYPSRSKGPLGCSRFWLLGEALSKQLLQAGCRLVLAAQNKEFRVAA